MDNFSRTSDEHIMHIRQSLDIISKYGPKVRVKKCCFALERIALFGHIMYREGVEMDSGKASSITDTPVPKSKI